MTQRYAIIGNGAAAVSMLGALLCRCSDASIEVDWYCGAAATTPRGIAFGTTSPRHLLNVRAGGMALLPSQPDAFVDFAREHLPGVSETDFLPRALYGDFLQAQMHQLLGQAQQAGIPVRRIPETVQAVRPENDAGGVLVTAGSQTTRHDAAVLALGVLPARPLGAVSHNAVASGAYVVDPWSFMAAPATAPGPRELVIVGMGLSAVDVALELAARWPQMHLTMISRHGRLPAAHGVQPPVRYERADALVQTMLDNPQLRQWTRLVREAMARSADWRSVMDALRPRTVELWLRLSTAERGLFLRHLRWAWDSARHRMAPPVAAAMAALEADGRLTRVAGRLLQVDVGASGLDLMFRRRGHADIETMSAERVIQTTGLEGDLSHAAHPLVRQLMDQHQVLVDPLGLGFQAETDGRLRHRHGSWPQLYALGSLMRGVLWESLAMPDIRQQADQVARQMLTKTRAAC